MAEKTIPSASFPDSLRYNLAQTFPVYLQGLFTRSKFWVSFWTRLGSDGRVVKQLTRMRSKYGPQVYVNVGGNRTLLLLDHSGAEHVLKNSPEIYASDPDAKRRGMAHFQPGALTISAGEKWRDRRRFNESVLRGALDGGGHSAKVLEVVRREAAALAEKQGGALAWQDFADAFDRITLQVIYGDRAGTDAALLRRLRKIMREANRVAGLRKSKHFDGYYSEVNGYLKNPRPHSLASLCAETPSTEDTSVPAQMTHWTFAMSETLAANTARALALVLAHPRAEQRAREELARAGIDTPEGVNGLKYLGACVQEAMRLWPTTPLLIRRALEEDYIGGARVERGTQILINNTFNHRDSETHPFADRFAPEIWLEGVGHDYAFNHLSNGPQACAGRDLALFIAKAFVASLLASGRYTLGGPKLDPGRPLPHMYNYFKVKLARA
ncbi:MAG TPA: cytochrome P450 [Pyrinomonadaceae bacterium]|nr:cytochrome P450 [Pyrinomonadaceae bacterium]